MSAIVLSPTPIGGSSGNGVPVVLAFAATTPTTPVGSTPIFASAPAGLYEVTIYSVITTSGTVGTGLNYNLIYTDAQGARTNPVIVNNSAITAGTVSQGVFAVQNQAVATISYSITENGAFTVHPILALQIAIKRLN